MNEKMSGNEIVSESARNEAESRLTVPSTAVQSGRVLSQLPEDLLHLESSGDGLDQDGRSNRSSSHSDRILRHSENVVPESRLGRVLELGDVERRSSSTSDNLSGVVEEVDSEIEEGSREVLSVDLDVGFLEVQSTRSA